MTMVIRALMPVAIVAGSLLWAQPALAAVSVARAEVSGSKLRIEGTALASRDITVDGVTMGRSDGSGAFEIRRDGYAAPGDCTVSLNDGSTPTETRLSGCTVSTPPPPADTTAPTAPTGLTAEVVGDTATLRWTASTDAVGVTGYRVRRNGAVAGVVSATSFTDPGLASGTYTYDVTAVDAAGNASAASSTASVTVSAAPAPNDTTAPTVPSDLTATVVGTTINVGWSMSSDDTRVAGYTLTRNEVVRGTTDTTSFTDSGLAAGTYTYTVSAFDAAGNTSAQSSSVSAVVQEPEGLTFLTPAGLPDAALGEPYLASIVASDPPGPSTFKFKIVSGRLPDGTRFLRNTLENRPEARVSGTPSARGTYSFTVEVEDGTGASARRTFTVRVL